MNNIDVVYTPWHNLKKTASMDVGQVGFYNSKMVRFFIFFCSVFCNFYFFLDFRLSMHVEDRY